MKRIVVLCLIIFGGVAQGQDLGPLSSQVQSATGFSEFQQTFLRASRELGREGLIRELYLWGCNISEIPSGTGTATVGAQRFNLFLNPGQNGSLVNRVYKKIAVKKLTNRPREAPRPYEAATLIQDSTSDYSATISGRIQQAYDRLIEDPAIEGLNE